MALQLGPPHPTHRFRGLPAVLLAVTVVLALTLAGMVGAELYARHRAEKLVAEAVWCQTRDSARVSFATSPPVLSQYFSGYYPSISVQTVGNQLRSAKGMRLDLDIRGVRLTTKDSPGTIASLTGSIAWPAAGIKASIEDVVPVIGGIVAGDVTTDPDTDTIRLRGLLDSATVRPQLTDNKLSLQVMAASALGHNLDTDSLQSHLDELTGSATGDLPLGIHLDSVQVTEAGLTVKFSARNATIPATSSSRCFAGV